MKRAPLAFSAGVEPLLSISLLELRKGKIAIILIIVNYTFTLTRS
jgi:hypothetical protein